MSGARRAGAGSGTAHDRVRRHVPIVAWLRSYDRRWLRADLLAGCVVAALAVPQALGYAAIAGVPIELGLYAVPVALIAYAVFGSSRQLVLGPVSTVSVLSGSLVAAMHPDDLAQAVVFTTGAAVWAGIILIVAAQLRVGWVAEFLSKPIVTGFVLGLTLLVILGELPNLLGIHVGPRDVVGRIRSLVEGIGQAEPLTVGISVVALAILFVGTRSLPHVPWSLVVLVVGLVGSQLFDLAGRGVAVVGFVPAGLPGPTIPDVPPDRLVDVAVAGAALAFVGLAEGLSAARLFSVKRGYRIRTDQELLAAGAANLASGLMGGLAVAGSLSKTAALDRSGGRTQVAGLAAAALSIAAIVFFAPTLGPLPKAVLSAIVVHAVWGLIDIPAMRRYRRSRRIDFVSAWVAVIAVLAAGPLLGLLIAIGWAVLGLVYRSSRVTIDVMGKVPGEKAAWGSMENHPERVTLPGVLVLRLNESLFWVNAARIKERVLEIVDDHPDVRALVLDLESTDQLEITSADMLSLLLDRLRGHGIDVYLVRVRFRVRKVLRNTGVRTKLGDDHLWHSISQGVRAARRDHGLKPPKPQPVSQHGSQPVSEPVSENGAEAGAAPVPQPGSELVLYVAGTASPAASVVIADPIRTPGSATVEPTCGDESGVGTDESVDDGDPTTEEVVIDDDPSDDADIELVLSRSMGAEPDLSRAEQLPPRGESHPTRKGKHKKHKKHGKNHH